MKDETTILPGEANRIAYFMWVANLIGGVFAIYPTLYALAYPPALIAPLIGYILLVGYWRRYNRPAEPKRWLWIATILFNLPVPVGTVIFGGDVKQAELLGLLVAWNLLMIYGAVRALFYDWAEIRDLERLDAEALTA